MRKYAAIDPLIGMDEMHGKRAVTHPMNLVASIALKAFYGASRFDLISLSAASSE
jgi:hypothetical protein